MHLSDHYHKSNRPITQVRWVGLLFMGWINGDREMITKKEDLINTYVKTDCEELVNLYLKKCKEFGFTWFSGKDINSSKANESAVGLNEDVKLSVTNGSLDYFNDRNCRELSLSDFKPRTKTEFVKCEYNHAWEAVKAFEDGEELYTKRSHKDFVLIDSAPDVLRFLYDLHRKVETEIDERQEFIDVACEIADWNIKKTMGLLFDSGKFKLVDSND